MKLFFPKFKFKLPTFKNVNRSTVIINTLAILFVTNLLASLFTIKIDLTENKAFTLSKVTKDLIGNLDDIITIKVFLTENLPPRLLPIKQKIKDTITQFQQTSPNKIKIIYIDPKSDQELVNQALSLGVPQLRFSDIQNDKFSVSTGFLGLAILFGDKKEVVEAVGDNTNLEYDLASAIKKVSEKNPVKIGLSSGRGEVDSLSISIFRALLEKDFEVSDLIFSDEANQKPIDEDIKTIVMVNPTDNFSYRNLLLLDQFLMRGGSLVVFLDTLGVSENLQPKKNNSNINEFLQNFGIKVNSDLILSKDNEIANFSTGYTAFITPYPFWVRINPSGFSQEYPATSGLDTAVLPWVSSLNLNKDAAHTKYTELVKTSKESFNQTGSINIDPTAEQKVDQNSLKKFTVAALLRGKYKSLSISNKDIKNAALRGESLITGGKDEARIAVFSDSDFLNDYFIRRYNGNAALALNIVESLSTDKWLAEIRTKGSNIKPLRNISDNQKLLIKWGNVIILPLLTILVGVTRFLLRIK